MAMQRQLDVTLISAKDLRDVNLFSKMEVYAILWLSSDPRARRRTRTDREGRTNPSWNNATFQFFLPPEGADLRGVVLHILLRSERVLGDRDVGEIHVPVSELESTSAATKSNQFVSYEVRRPSGKPKGMLNFSFRFADPVAIPAPAPSAASYSAPAPYPSPVVASYAGATPAYPAPGVTHSDPYPPPGSSKAEEPVTAYPAGPGAMYPPPGAAPYPPHGYPPYPSPPQQSYGYGVPQPGYGYPPHSAYGYGAPGVVQPQQPKKNKFGMGLGAGLLGGALGGLLIGDMISDASAYDAGYDAGFDDGGGFGF